MEPAGDCDGTTAGRDRTHVVLLPTFKFPSQSYDRAGDSEPREESLRKFLECRGIGPGALSFSRASSLGASDTDERSRVHFSCHVFRIRIDRCRGAATCAVYIVGDWCGIAATWQAQVRISDHL